MPIQILSDKVASAIAAGEVIERPVSVVKELIENALDAEAQAISVVIESGGRKSIEVGDDGIGIPEDEVPLALERYSTSKLARAEDLFAIQSLGFRGEALSSIAAVSKLGMTTRAADQPSGVQLMVEGGQAGKVKKVGAPKGTLVRVRDLYFNVPARRKFLKSETSERRQITSLVTRYAFAYPEVRFKLETEGRLRFQSSGRGDRREVLSEILGVDTARQMIALPAMEGGASSLSGFISPPSLHRGNRRDLTFYVNGRWVKDASLVAAVRQAYHTLMMVGRYPIVFLLLDLPADSVDVNVHPAKTEIRFREPELVFSLVKRVVRGTLLGQVPTAAHHFDQTWRYGIEKAEMETSFAIGLLDVNNREGGISSAELQPVLPGDGLPLLRSVGQVGAAYLVAEGPDGLYLIDQHAAHERVLFEALMKGLEGGAVESQQLLEPITVEFNPSQVAVLEEQLEALTDLGFEVETFGPNVYRVRSLPAILVNYDPARALRIAIEDFEEDETPLEGELETRLAARVCKRAAVKAGQVLTLEEQRKLLLDLERCEVPRSCPHGRPTMIHLSVETLERQFGRRG